jgi:hypothetical protein
MRTELSPIAKHLLAMLDQFVYVTTTRIVHALPDADDRAVAIEICKLIRAGIVTRGFVRHSEPLETAYWLKSKRCPPGVVEPGIGTSADFASEAQTNMSEVSHG